MSMPPPIPVRCEVCFVASTPDKPVRTCSRCRIHAYCSREHQLQDWPHHKLFCCCLLELTDIAARAERHLRAAPRGTVCDGKLFDEAIGHFTQSREATNVFMRTKYAIVHTLAFLRQANEKVAARALPEALDCLHLCRKDDNGVRFAVPAFMLQLGQLQECYDFLKWCAVCNEDGTCDWSDPDTPFRAVHNADMTEPMVCFNKTQSPFLLGPLTFIKVTIARILENAVACRTAVQTMEQDDHTIQALDQGGLLAVLDLSLPELTKLHHATAQEATEAFWMAHASDPDYWTAVLDPQPVVKTCLTTQPRVMELSDGACASIPAWVAINAAVWASHHEFIHSQLAMV